jgi:hypothetical protein
MSALVTRHCECEHVAHSRNREHLTPNGNPGHKYGVRYALSYLVKVKTTYGTFEVCKDCADDCYQNEPREIRRAI